MAKRSYDPARVRGLLADRDRHGWSLGELSRRSGVPVGTLSNWAAQARRSSAGPAPRGFTQLVVSHDQGSAGSASVVLRHEAGWTAELHGDAARELTAQLVELVTRCS